MDKIELKEMDREILQLWERNVKLEKIELMHPKARSRIGAYRSRKVVDSGRGVDWAKFEAVDPPQMRGGAGVETLQRITGEATGDATTPLQCNTEETGEKLHRTTGDATKAELETLQRRYAVLQGRLEKVEAVVFRSPGNGAGGVRSGERSTRPRSYRFDTGLLKALQDRAGAEGISETEALHRAIEAYLGNAGNSN